MYLCKRLDISAVFEPIPVTLLAAEKLPIRILRLPEQDYKQHIFGKTPAGLFTMQLAGAMMIW